MQPMSNVPYKIDMDFIEKSQFPTLTTVAPYHTPSPDIKLHQFVKMMSNA